jgi:signal transduction histidine kinase
MPGRSRAFFGRVVLAATLCVGVGFITDRVIRNVVAPRLVAQRFLRPQLGYLYDRYERARCEASPDAWSMVMDGGATTFAYDGDNGRARNLAAPALPREWSSRVPNMRDVAVELHSWTVLSGVIHVVSRTAAHGPCAILQTVWPEQRFSDGVIGSVEVGTLFATLTAIVLGIMLLVPPVERLQRRSAALQRHLADVAHDLKTPISSLQLGLEEALAAPHETRTRELLTQALGDVVYLGALTSNLRMASEMSEGWNPGVEGIAVNLGDVVDRVVMRARLFARHKHIAVESAVPDAPLFAQCDPVAIEQALSNIVENAITHGHGGQHVAVLLERSEAQFRLTVVDDGPGVPPSALPHLGTRTFRADEARQRDPRGSGLGLAIASEVCRRCGWRLSFAHEQPQGLRVTIVGGSRDT